MIERHSMQPGGLQPEVVEYLASVPDSLSRHLALKLRPPLGAYNISFGDLISSFERTLSALEELRRHRTWTSDKGGWSEQLNKEYKALLYSIFEHFDVCRNIMLCFLPDTVVLAKDPAVKIFDKGTRLYRAHFGAVVNRLKHNQRRVSGIVFYNEHDSIPGHYIETVGELPSGSAGGAMGPDPDIHRDGDTAFSSHRQLRFQFATVYLVGRHLARAVKALTGAVSCATAQDEAMDRRIYSVAKAIAELPCSFYPDEINQPVPAVGVAKSAGSISIWVDYPSHRLRPIGIATPSIAVSFGGDGVTKTFKLPYSLPSSWR